MIEKKLTVKDRKKAQPSAVMLFSNEEKMTIANTVAKGLTEPQRNIFFYTCQALGLNPLLNEITAISYAGTMSIQVMRDGFLTIAHRSGKFAGLESGVKEEGTKKIGWARVYHKDFTVPVYQEADLPEYSTGKNLWVSKPNTMIKKVAESMALRKAFNVSGVYAPEEMEREIKITTTAPIEADMAQPATTQQTDMIKQLIAANEKDPNKAQEEIAKVDELNLTAGEAMERIRELTPRRGKK